MVSYASLIALVVAGVLFALFSFAIYLFTPPQNFPKNIPTVPFYLTLLPLIKDVDQADLYRKYLKEPLQKYGAVKIFFGGRWNILLQKPSYVAEVFKYEDIYAKSGNQVKLPQSIVAEYTGDNIISSHGENWRLFTSVIKPALQHEQDPIFICRNSKVLKTMLLEEASKAPSGFVVYGLLQRYALANLSETLFGLSFETLQRPDASLHSLQMRIKPTIFNPIFLNFPFLDHYKWKSRQLGRELVRKFRNTLRTDVAKGHNHVCDHESAKLGCRMLGAHRMGLLSEKQLQDNLVSVFLAGHENPQLALISLLYLLGEHPAVQEEVRKEINIVFNNNEGKESEASYIAIHGLPILTSVIYETLRLYPPISQLLNRRTSVPNTLGNNIFIPAGVYVGYNCYATNRDTSFWGPDADDFKPSRWGSTLENIKELYRKAKAKGAFISFHGGRRACLGQRFAMQELRVTMVEILRGMRWTVDERWDGRMTPAGPLYPRNLRIKFQELKT
ncbi:cytochrome P450 [Lindgomyces ingoldianus]|uniref:Cytochrome P450 n=1 Tax=Lindgomyces ingoldianus TaxID=673940 RepID=A0ACB6RG48_9PLEO|nr:cytochrome P450 [Lindgomyces ingoldianus]KAF2477700.1 cytochrome P450 [Lindgomyces ingoldianus]